MRITIYGAGGPVAQAGVRWLEADHTLRLTDLQPLETAHESMVVDITDPAQVKAAAEGADVLINCTVNRPHPTLAFDVNLRGAYNLMLAAVECGVPRVIQTGPTPHLSQRSGYPTDHGVSEEAPERPGTGLYAITKHLGQEVIRIFTARHPELTVVTFVYSGFYSTIDPRQGRHLPDFAVHEDDAGQAFRLGAEVPREQLPSNDELFFISADLPHGRYSIEKAKRVLGYQPRHNFEVTWSRSALAAWEAEHTE